MLESIEECRVNDFINSLSQVDDDILDLKKYALENNVPIIRDEARDFLRFIIDIKKPSDILEIGTAIAYSTLIMHKEYREANITTIEDFDRRIKEAKNNIEKYFDTDKITLIEKDAGVYLKECKNEEVFDLVFLDAAKGQYINWLNDIKRVTKKNGIILADNIFKDGEILESKYLIKKRDRTIHKRMRDFLYEIKHDDELITYIYNLGDGISVSIKK